MKEAMNDILTRLIREDRPVRFEVGHTDWLNRFEVSHMDWLNRFAVTYRFADESGIRRTVIDDLFVDDAQRLVDQGNVALGSLLSPPKYYR